MPAGGRFVSAAGVVAALAVVLVPVLFRRPASTISDLADIDLLAEDVAYNGTPDSDGVIRGGCSIFPYRISTALLPDSSILAIVESPVALEPGRLREDVSAIDLGGFRYALLYPGMDGGTAARALLDGMEHD